MNSWIVLGILFTSKAYEITELPFAFSEYIQTGGFPEAVGLSADGNHLATQVKRNKRETNKYKSEFKEYLKVQYF